MIDLLQQGIVAAQAGKREEARALLMQVVEGDERNEQAWLWLAGVVDEPEDIRTCLQNVLDLNPANQQAQQGLVWVEQRYKSPKPAAPVPAPPPKREVAVALPPPAAPEQQRSFTGPTTKLASEAVPPAVSTAAPSVAPVMSIAAPVPDHPCPYCGAPTVLQQQACTQCRGNLMMRAAPPRKRSLALTVLGFVWGIGGVLLLLVTVLLFFVFLWLRQSAQAAIASGSSDTLLLAVAVTLVLGLFYIMLARGLLARQLWAYITNIVLIVLGFFGTLSSLAASTVLIALLLSSLGRTRNAQAGAGTAGLIAVIVIGMAFILLPIVLTILSYRDFFGPKVRLEPLIDSAEHLVHYNNGIAYKNRGMWYMAVQEWEVAVSKKPYEPNYLHALGLAYAQLKQPQKARVMLDRAVEVAPDNPQIKESRAIIDQIATKK